MDSFTNIDFMSFFSGLGADLSLETFVKIFIGYIFIVWVAIIIWVTKDIINRTNNIFLQVFSIMTVLVLTPLGIVIYLLIRPSKTLFEQYYEESELDEEYDEGKYFIDDDNIEKEKYRCYKCNYDILPEFKFCPNCRVELRNECIKCGKELKHSWTICPYCGKDQEQKILNLLSEKKEEKEHLNKNDENIIDDKEV